MIWISGYFTDEGSADMASMREGLKLSRKLANSESFNKYKGEEIFPGKNVQSDDELDAYIRNVRANYIFLFHHNYSMLLHLLLLTFPSLLLATAFVWVRVLLYDNDSADSTVFHILFLYYHVCFAFMFTFS